MSHFSVLVIGPDIEAQLAPYQENNMGDCPKHLLKYRVDGEWFDSEEQAASKLGAEAAKEGYPENPNAKWDWYVVGGRWTGFFKLKAGAVGALGERSLLSSRDAEAGTADVLRKGDIDFASMRNEAGNKAANEYDMAMRIIGHLPKNKTWQEVRAECGDNHDKARTMFWDQERCTAWKAEEAKVGYKNWPFGFDTSPDDFVIDRERYIQNARNKAGTTFAVLKDGKWYERGKMGWWACVSDEKDAETWTSMFANLIDGLPDDTQLTVVDCHI